MERNRTSPDPEIAKSISNSSLKCSIWSWVMRPSAAWRTVSGLKTCLFTGNILPSILILTGALQVKNRSDAFRSTISLNSGLGFITCAGTSGDPAICLEHLAFFFPEDLQRLTAFLRLLDASLVPCLTAAHA